jgi:hypothetical protein
LGFYNLFSSWLSFRKKIIEVGFALTYPCLVYLHISMRWVWNIIHNVCNEIQVHTRVHTSCIIRVFYSHPTRVWTVLLRSWTSYSGMKRPY